MFKFVMTKNSIELFHRAILSNDLSRTKLILEEAMKDPRFDIDEINEEGLTALQFSCFAGHLEIVKVLISYKADVKKRDRDGNSLLHAAALAGKVDIVKYLLRCGIKPTIRNDDNQMPIDFSEEIAIIVILLRAMLDQGYLEEMQEYMIDHPKLKRNIFEELKRVKCRETEQNQILQELPYSSHTSPRRQINKSRKPSDELQGRSISTFSKLSDSMQYLDQIDRNETNNNYNQHYHKNNGYSYDNAPTLKRNNSTSSSSSHGSRSSRSSKGSGAGILRHESNDYESRHKQTQKYLENRFPQSMKSVSFESDHQGGNNRSYSDGYHSDSFDDKIPKGRLSRSSSISSHSSNHTGVFSDTCSNFDFPTQPPPHEPPKTPTRQQEEAIYANFQPVRSNSLPTIAEGENIYENLPLRGIKPSPKQQTPKFVAPPLPPRQPTTPPKPKPQQSNRHSNLYEYESTSYSANTYQRDTSYPANDNRRDISYSANERQLGSETDSGIDINETAGRVFALSLDDQQQPIYPETPNIVEPPTQTSYSKPIGIYYSQQTNVTARQSGKRDANVLIPTNTHLNPKYRSWNGRTLLESQQQAQDNLAPYSNHDSRSSGRPQRTSRDDYDVYKSQQAHAQEQNGYQAQRRHTNGGLELRQFNFDHQPEIML